MYWPAGTPWNAKTSLTAIGSDVLRLPETSSTRPVAAPPANVFFQASASDCPLAVPSRPAGADGGTGTLTCARISFDGPLTCAPATVRTRR